MENIDQATETIFKEIISDNTEVRNEYLKLFEEDTKTLSKSMARAFIEWRNFDKQVKKDEKLAHISSLLHTAITLHILSFKLLISGQTIASGNLFRQVIESIAISLLCSGKELDVLSRFMKNKYSATYAVRDILRHADKLSLKPDSLDALKDAQKYYHKYSHITMLTIAIGMSFSQIGGLYVGASFDEAKANIYSKEVEGRVSLAEVFSNFIAGVSANVEKW